MQEAPQFARRVPGLLVGLGKRVGSGHLSLDVRKGELPGRVGDCPGPGAGLHVDGDVGAAGSTGRGEAKLYNLSSFMIVENMRRGLHPKDAGLDVLRRIKVNTIEKRLQTANGNPNFHLNFYIINAKGEYAGVSRYEAHYAVCTEGGAQTLATEQRMAGTAPD